MRLDDGRLVLSASDLANHLACPHRTELDRALAHRLIEGPRGRDPGLEALIERGFAHEAAYVDALRDQGLAVIECPDDWLEAGRTAAHAMRAGADVIVQAVLAGRGWHGRADILRRVEEKSALGDWSYEVADTKLTSETRAGTILQLCLYSDLLAELLGREPVSFHVVMPGDSDAHPFKIEAHRFHDYHAYYRLVRHRLDASVRGERAAAAGTLALYPEPVDHCAVCKWWPRCDERRRADDHLSLVANLTRLQRAELESRGIRTLAAFAREPLPLPWKPRRGSLDALEREREQARVQLEGRTRGVPVHELLLPVVQGFGLARLPEPSPGDLFLDLEGDPFVGRGGREYLFGTAWEEPGGTTAYQAWWALDAASERAGFEAFVDRAIERWEQDPGMHIYHYAPYEPAALKRLMGRHASREDQVDRLLRGQRFVDLYQVVRHALRAGVESYSIKDLEPFFGHVRDIALTDVAPLKRALEHALEVNRLAEIAADARDGVERYNQDDCLSALALRGWLERLRVEQVLLGADVPRPPLEPGEPPEALNERQLATRALAEALTRDVPADPVERTAEQAARWLLAQLLEFHRREDKAVWWEYYRLCDLGDDDLLDEKGAVAGLEFETRAGGTDRCPVHRYRFPAQDCDVREGGKLYARRTEQVGGFAQENAMPGVEVGDVVEIDLAAGRLDLKKREAARELHPAALFQHDHYGAAVMENALFRLGEEARDHGVEAGPAAAWRELLLARPPRLAAGESLAPHAHESTLERALRLVHALDHTVLPIQGPPGAGKTYTGARMILALVKDGRKVGVCANSHKVIVNLLEAAAAAARAESATLRICRKVSDEPAAHPDLRELGDNAAVLAALQCGDAQVAGGTAWLWSRPEFAGAVDVLFVDEAGQMALANALAIAPAARSLVLLGDPRQLEQPIQGSHPEGAAVSALDHLLGVHLTMPAERGLFLAETWRLPGSICRFTSELFYEGRLESRPESRGALAGGAFDGGGLWYLPVEHQGYTNAAPEEAAAIERLVASLFACGASWTGADGATRALTPSDVLVVSPYNAQVRQLAERLAPLGATRVGSVDRFQGGEAPVVIYSLATSTPDDAPRGMEFLYSLNRLNVATSRAQGACILVANPRLLEPECRSPRQMQLANALCRYRELAKEVAQGVLAGV